MTMESITLTPEEAKPTGDGKLPRHSLTGSKKRSQLFAITFNLKKEESHGCKRSTEHSGAQESRPDLTQSCGFVAKESTGIF